MTGSEATVLCSVSTGKSFLFIVGMQKVQHYLLYVE